jgi:hypothetical protein
MLLESRTGFVSFRFRAPSFLLLLLFDVGDFGSRNFSFKEKEEASELDRSASILHLHIYIGYIVMI